MLLPLLNDKRMVNGLECGFCADDVEMDSG